MGNTQVVAEDAPVVFDLTEEDLDVVGTEITVDATGTEFTIHQAGLYHVEWSLNLAAATQPVLIGLSENGEGASVITNSNPPGNISSGALISVAEDELPYVLKLQNFGGEFSLADAAGYGGTAASIRILRFADGPSV